MATPASPRARPDANPQSEHPWAIAVLREQFDSIEAAVEQVEGESGQGEAQARGADLLRAVDRHLRLEDEVLYPVLDIAGIDTRTARASHEALRAAWQAAAHQAEAGDRGIMLDVLRDAVIAHRQAEERSLFPEAGRLSDEDMAALGLELDEVRQRMSGAYGV